VCLVTDYAAKIKLDRTGAPGVPVVMTLLKQFLSDRHEGWES
jgi:hypothetical protein